MKEIISPKDVSKQKVFFNNVDWTKERFVGAVHQRGGQLAGRYALCSDPKTIEEKAKSAISQGFTLFLFDDKESLTNWIQETWKT